MPIWDIAFGALSGLVLFLYGIEHFSTEIQSVAGDRFRAWLGKLTKTPLRGALLGAITTMLVQSSSATTVIAIGLVNAGSISFFASLGIIFGANVGTTVTAQLVALQLTSFAPMFIVLGFVLSLAGGRLRFLGRPIFYFGLVFLALMLVSNAIEPLRTDARVPGLLARFSSVPLALMAGFAFTVVVQSSSVTSGVVVLLADAGVVSIEQAIPILLGANLGTTTTSLIAASRMSLHARRAAMAHLLFNVGGVLLFLPTLSPFADLVSSIGGAAAQQVANAHLIFNGTAAVVFLLGARPLRTLVERLVQGDEEEILVETEHLDGALPNELGPAFRLIEAEIAHLLHVTKRLFENALLAIHRPSPHVSRMVQKLETLNDFLDERIEGALVQLSRRALDERAAERVVMLVRVCNQLEQLGDTAATLASLGESGRARARTLPVATVSDIEEAGALLHETLELQEQAFPHVGQAQAEALKASQRRLRKLLTDKYAIHVGRIATEDDYPGPLVVDALSLFEAASNQLREIRKQLESPTVVQDV